MTYAATRRAELPQKVCKSMSLMTGILHVDHCFAGDMQVRSEIKSKTWFRTPKEERDWMHDMGQTLVGVCFYCRFIQLPETSFWWGGRAWSRKMRAF